MNPTVTGRFAGANTCITAVAATAISGVQHGKRDAGGPIAAADAGVMASSAAKMSASLQSGDPTNP